MTHSDVDREVPSHIKDKPQWRYIQRNAGARMETQKKYYEANKERIKNVRQARLIRQKVEKDITQIL
jgi:hypothetical protein